MAKELILTGVDVLLDYVKKKGKVTVKDAAKIIGYPVSVIEDWANILEEEGLISIEYKFTKTFLVNKSITQKKEVKKEIRKTIMKGAAKKKERQGPVIEVEEDKGKKSKSEDIFVKEVSLNQTKKLAERLKKEAEKQKKLEDEIPKIKKKFSIFPFRKKPAEEEEAKEEAEEPEKVQNDEGAGETAEEQPVRKSFFEKLRHKRQMNQSGKSEEEIKKDVEAIRKAEDELIKTVAELDRHEKEEEKELKEEIQHVLEKEQQDIKEVQKIPEEVNHRLLSMREIIKRQQRQISQLRKDSIGLQGIEKRIMSEIRSSGMKSNLTRSQPWNPFSSLFHGISISRINRKYGGQISELQNQLIQIRQSQKSIENLFAGLNHNQKALEHRFSELVEEENALKREEIKLHDEIKAKVKPKQTFLSVIARKMKGPGRKFKRDMSKAENELQLLQKHQIKIERELAKVEKENLILKKQKMKFEEDELLLKKAMKSKVRKPFFFSNYVSRIRLARKYKQESSNLQNQLSGVKHNQKVLENELKKLSEKNKALENQKTRLKRMVRPQKHAISFFSRRIANHRIPKSYNKQMQDMKKQMSFLTDEQKDLHKQLSKVKDENRSLKMQEGTLTKNLESFRPQDMDANVREELESQEIAEKRQHDQKQKELQLRRAEIQHKREEIEKKVQLLQQKKNKFTDKTKQKSLFGAFIPGFFRANMQEPENAKILGTSSYGELSEEANELMLKSSGKLLYGDATIIAKKHEPFAQHLIKIIEAEENHLLKKGRISRHKAKSLKSKRQRVKEKLKKLELEKQAMNKEEFVDQKLVLNHVLNKIDNLLRNQK
jgi:hypothetical protein